MKRIPDIFAEKDKTYSIEFFPPKTPEGYDKLLKVIGNLAAEKPDFMTCTYGAGGGNRDKTLEIVKHIQDAHSVPSVHHLTCVCHTKSELIDIVGQIKDAGVRNIIALRGDPPQDNPDWTPGPDNFQYSSEMITAIRENFDDHFGIAVAGFPEGHLLAKDKDEDAKYLKVKVDAGADVIITQLFFENEIYFDYVKRVQALGVTQRIIPGILPITDYKGLLRFCKMCGASIPQKVHDIFEPIQDDKDKMREAGTEFAIAQCKELLDGGAPGIHFYCLNRTKPVLDILKAIRG